MPYIYISILSESKYFEYGTLRSSTNSFAKIQCSKSVVEQTMYFRVSFFRIFNFQGLGLRPSVFGQWTIGDVDLRIEVGRFTNYLILSYSKFATILHNCSKLRKKRSRREESSQFQWFCSKIFLIKVNETQKCSSFFIFRIKLQKFEQIPDV